MTKTVCYLLLQKDRNETDLSEDLDFIQRCSDAPKACFIKTACHVYKDHYDFIYMAEAFGWSYRLNDYHVVFVPGGNMSALCLRFGARIVFQLEASAPNFITPDMALKAYEGRKSQFEHRNYEKRQAHIEAKRNELRELLDGMTQ